MPRRGAAPWPRSRRNHLRPPLARIGPRKPLESPLAVSGKPRARETGAAGAPRRRRGHAFGAPEPHQQCRHFSRSAPATAEASGSSLFQRLRRYRRPRVAYAPIRSRDGNPSASRGVSSARPCAPPGAPPCPFTRPFLGTSHPREGQQGSGWHGGDQRRGRPGKGRSPAGRGLWDPF